jgi:sphingomyelin phosphodiesterase acid-like 3
VWAGAPAFVSNGSAMKYTLKFFLILLFVFSGVFAQAKTVTFLSIADIHFDPYIACHNEKPCPLIEALSAAPYQQWSQIFRRFSSKRSIRYGQDTPNALFQSLLTSLKKRKPRFAVLLGDFLAHRYYDQYREYSGDSKGVKYRQFVDKTFQYLMVNIKKALGNVPIYPVIGNNDAYGSPDCSRPDYCVIPHGPFLSRLTRIWQHFLISKQNKQSFQQTFPAAGFYTITPPGFKQLRVIALNTSLFSVHAKGREIDPFSQKQLQWLKKTLMRAKRKHQQVLLLFHIPPEINAFSTLKSRQQAVKMFWRKPLQKNFFKVISPAAKNILGVLTGHVHMDGFSLIQLSGARSVVDIYTSSVSPIFGNNPGYKLFSWNTKTRALTNYTTYYLPLNGDLHWQKEYSFHQAYQSSCKKHCTLLGGIQHLRKTGITANYFIYSYVAAKNRTILMSRWLTYFLCVAHNVKQVSYKSCLRLV